MRKRLAVARQAARYNEDEEDDMLYDEIDPMSWDLAQVSCRSFISSIDFTLDVQMNQVLREKFETF